VFYFVA
jgi:hypothetical protein